MTFEVEVGGRPRVLEIRRSGPEWVATIGGRSFRVSAEALGERWSVLVAPLNGGAYSSHDVALADSRAGERLVYIDGYSVAVRVGATPLASGRVPHPTATSAAAGPTSILAPMPGRIVHVLVQPGQPVAAAQGLVVMEAMKMENELRAPRGGRVAAVRVSPGMTVEARTVVVTLE